MNLTVAVETEVVVVGSASHAPLKLGTDVDGGLLDD